MDVTLETLRTDLRLALADTGTNPKASDELLNMCIGDAITLWSSQLPFIRTAEVTLDGQSYRYPDNCAQVYRMYGPFASLDDPQWVLRATRADWQTGTPVCFVPNYPVEGYYYFPTAPLGNFTLLWGEILEVPTSDAELIELGNRHWGKQAIRMLAGYYAFFANATFRSRIEQWETRLDKGVGNPFAEEAKRWLADYMRLMETYAQATGVDY